MEYFSQSLKSGEEPIALWRKHAATLIIPLGKGVVLILIAILLMDYLLATKWLSLFFAGLLLLAIATFVYEWFTWYFHAVLLTNQRIISINQKGLFSREVREVPLGNIQDVTFKIDGFGATIFRYGDISIFADNAKKPLVLYAVPRPGQTREVIAEIREKIVGNKRILSAAELIGMVDKARSLSKSGTVRVEVKHKGSISSDSLLKK